MKESSHDIDNEYRQIEKQLSFSNGCIKYIIISLVSIFDISQFDPM